MDRAEAQNIRDRVGATLDMRTEECPGQQGRLEAKIDAVIDLLVGLAIVLDIDPTEQAEGYWPNRMR